MYVYFQWHDVLYMQFLPQNFSFVAHTTLFCKQHVAKTKSNYQLCSCFSKDEIFAPIASGKIEHKDVTAATVRLAFLNFLHSY